MNQKLISSYLIVLVMIIPSIFSNQMNRIDLQFGQSKSYEFIDGNSYEINAPQSKYKQTVVQICSDTFYHDICRIIDTPSYSVLTVSCWVFRNLKFPYEIKLEYLESDSPCKLQINLFAFNKNSDEGTIDSVFSIPTKIGEIQQGQIAKNYVFNYTFSSPQYIENNKITISVKFQEGGLLPQLKPTCKSGDYCYKSPLKKQRTVGEMVILELEEAKGDINIQLTGGDIRGTNKLTSYRLFISDNKSILELSVTNSRFLLGANSRLQFSNLQTLKNQDDYNLFQVKVCEGSLSLAAQNSNRDLKTIGKNIWIFEKQDTSIIDLFSREDSYFQVKKISGFSKQLFLAITSPLEYKVENQNNGVIKVMIKALQFNLDKVTIPDRASIYYKAYFYQNPDQRQSETQCFDKNEEPKDKDYQGFLSEDNYFNSTSIVIDVEYSEKLGNFVEVTAYLNVKDSIQTEDIIFHQTIY